MGYIFILLTSIFNVTKGLCSKKASYKMDCLSDNINMNLLRNSMCVILGALFILFIGNGEFSMPPMGLFICTCSGAVMAFSYVVWVMSLKTDSYMFASAANNAGFIIAALCGILFFGEKLTICKAFAILFIIIALYFMTLYQTSFDKKPSAHDIFVLVLVFASSGLNATVQKWFTVALPGTAVHLYTFYTFIVSVILLSVYRLISRSPKTVSDEVATMKTVFPLVVIMSFSLYGATYFQALAATMLDAVVLYPTSNAINLIGGSIMAWIMFGEKPNKYSIIGTVLIFIALVMSRF